MIKQEWKFLSESNTSEYHAKAQNLTP